MVDERLKTFVKKGGSVTGSMFSGMSLSFFWSDGFTCEYPLSDVGAVVFSTGFSVVLAGFSVASVGFSVV